VHEGSVVLDELVRRIASEDGPEAYLESMCATYGNEIFVSNEAFMNHLRGEARKIGWQDEDVVKNLGIHSTAMKIARFLYRASRLIVNWETIRGLYCWQMRGANWLIVLIPVLFSFVATVDKGVVGIQTVVRCAVEEALHRPSERSEVSNLDATRLK